MRVVVVNHLSLDGVLQAPGRPEEDTREGFRHGGWASAVEDPDLGVAMGEVMGEDFSWLFGARSYDDMLGYWNETGGPFAEGLNRVHKYVVSSEATRELPWPGSTLLAGDGATQVAALRDRPGGNLVVMGSGELVRSLLRHGLVDEMLLMIHPVVLGSGRRLFGPADEPFRLRLTASRSTPSGVLLATYRSG